MEPNLILLKRHLRIDDMDDATEDAYVTSLWHAAEGEVIGATNRTAEELVEMGGGAYPADLEVAIMMETAHLYDQREGTMIGTMSVDPYVQSVVKKYEKLSDRQG